MSLARDVAPLSAASPLARVLHISAQGVNVKQSEHLDLACNLNLATRKSNSKNFKNLSDLLRTRVSLAVLFLRIHSEVQRREGWNLDEALV